MVLHSRHSDAADDASPAQAYKRTVIAHQLGIGGNTIEMHTLGKVSAGQSVDVGTTYFVDHLQGKDVRI